MLQTLDAHVRAGRPCAIDDTRGRVSYAELATAAGRCASGLRARGLGPGSVVAIALEPSAPYVALVLGALSLGAVAAPVNTRLRPVEVSSYLRTIGADLLVTDADLDPASASPAPVVVLDGVDARRALAARLAGIIGPEPERHPVRGDAPAIIFPTGGTTGTPKGAVITAGALTRWLASIATNSGRRPSDVELCLSPFFHVSLLATVMSTLFAGGTAIVHPRAEAGAAMHAIEALGVTRLLAAPTLLDSLREAPGYHAAAARILHLHFGSMPSTPTFVARLLAEFPNAVVSTGYGATEYGPVTRVEDADLRRGRITGVGRPCSGVTIRVVDEDGAALPHGVTGEIEVLAPWQASNYRGNEAETAQTWRPDGFIRLGDLGHLAPDGWLTIAGRSKEMILTGGENVFPSEVEAVLAAHPGVQAAAAYGVADARWGERVEAAVVARAGTSVDLDEVVRFARERLAAYKVPKHLHEVDALPLTPNNKVDRQALGRRFGLNATT